MTPFVQVRDLGKSFAGGRSLLGFAKKQVRAIQEISFSMNRGDILGVVGESGCGKSTLARTLVGLLTPDCGSIEIDGSALHGDREARQQRLVQYVFQDPIAALNPRKTVAQILGAPLIHLCRLSPKQRLERTRALLAMVSLHDDALTRYPHEFSGGQAQRIVIARSLAAEPQLLVLDEPVSALDVSVQAQVLNLLRTLHRDLQLTYLFISHDLSVIEAFCDRVLVMYFGRIVEVGLAQQLLLRPAHPYTRLLAESAPVVGKHRSAVAATATASSAELPDPLNPPRGCAFASRCNRATGLCRTEVPLLTQLTRDQEVACHHPVD